MTGFARVRKNGEAGEAVVSIRRVNHRGLDMHVHMPPELDSCEFALRAAIKRRAARGHLQVHVSFTRAHAAAPPEVNRPLLESYLAAFRQAAADYRITGEPDLNVALSMPGMIREAEDAEPGEDVQRLVVAAVEDAMDALNVFREREGAEIASDLRARARAVAEMAVRMEDIRSRAVLAFQARLSERLQELLKAVPLDPQRLLQETAVLADRSDIGEELARLRIHAGQVESLLSEGGEVGKKLDFLLQEMNRETNTVLSKTTGVGELGLGITDLSLTAKAEIERIREQSLNLE